ncbi:MAG: serine/threonine-protein kinase [Coprobacillus sp.]
MSIDIYQELRVIKESEDKSIYLVQSAIDNLYYIKRILKQYDKRIYEILQSLNNPHIPQIIEIKEENGVLTVIEEYINAPTLDSYIVNNELDTLQIIDIIKQLCDILDILHQHQIIHRDIKPENIFYNNQDIILFDFDIARTYQPNHNRDTMVLGSVGYAAPEQFGFKQSDGRTDVYALGVLLNVLFTKHLPNEELYQGKVKYVILKATELDPIKRYQTTIELKEAIIENMGMSSWALPGFRGGTLKTKIWAAIGYLVFLSVIIMSEFEGIPRWSIQEFGNKLVVFGFICILIVFCSNYKNVNRIAFFHRSKNIYIKMGGIVLSTILIEFLYMMMCGIVQMIIK